MSLVIINFGSDAESFFSYPGVEDVANEYAQMAVPPMKGDFDKEKYFYMAELCTFFAVADKGRAIGVAVVFRTGSNHIAQDIAALESYYIDRAHRGTRAGWKLLVTVYEYAKEEGAEIFLASAQVGSGLDKYLGRRMKHFQNIYVAGLK